MERGKFSRVAQMAYAGTERRSAEPSSFIRREEFDELKNDVASIKSALFADNDQGEHHQVGLMTMAKRIDNHMTVMCNFAGWIKTAIKLTAAVIIGVSAVAAALSQLGLL